MALLKENKIEHYKTEDIELKFHPFAFLPNAPEAPKSEASQDEDELLFYSAPPRRD